MGDGLDPILLVAPVADYSARDEWEGALTAPGSEDYRYLVSAIDTSKSYGMDRFRNPWLFNVQAASMSLISPQHPHTYRDFGFIFGRAAAPAATASSCRP